MVVCHLASDHFFIFGLMMKMMNFCIIPFGIMSMPGGEERLPVAGQTNEEVSAVKTILDMKKDFDSITEIYGEFPLREDFLEAGNAALEALDLKAYMEGREIRIPFLSRPYYDEEDLEEFRDSGWEDKDIEDVRKWTLKAEAVILIRKNLQKGILEVGMDCDVEGLGEYDEVYPEDAIDEEDEEEAVRVMATFLNLAVDVD